MSSDIATLQDRAVVLLDHVIASAPVCILFLPIFLIFPSPVTLLAFLGVFLVANVAYFTYFEARLGHTPAKNYFGLRVVGLDGEEITSRQSLVRNLFRIVDASTMYLTGAGFALASPTGQRLGDWAAGTTVVGADHSGRVTGERVDQNTRLIGYALAITGLSPLLGLVLSFVNA